MKRIFKKLMALTLVLAMVGSTMAMAAPATTGSSANGTGNMEGYIEPEVDVFSVELPTVTAFDFQLDPQGLIEETGGDRYGELTATSTTGVYFKNTNEAGTTTGYSEYSDVLAIVNRGNIGVNVGLNATLTLSAGLTLATTAAAANSDNKANVFMGVETATVEDDGSLTWGSPAVAAAASAVKVYGDSGKDLDPLKHSVEPTYVWNGANYEKIYENDTVEYDAVYFRVTGAINTAETAKAAWDAVYAASKADDDPVAISVVLNLAWTVTASKENVAHTTYVKPYTVTFDMGEWGTDFTQEVKGDNNSYATEPTAPVVDGYEFVDWYVDAEFSAPFDFEGTKITNNTTVVYAKYVGAVGVRNFTATVGENVAQTATVVLPAGATGITSITDANGVAIVNTRYTFDAENNTLTIQGLYLKNLAEGTHTFTVVFDDEDATSKEFKIIVNPVTPAEGEGEGEGN